MHPDPQAFIRANLPLAVVPTVPDIRLHQAHAGSGLWRLAERDESGFGSPYWAYPWAGGLALARYIVDRPSTVAGRRVLDLGAGSGLVGIAAAKAGAAAVLAADVDAYAMAALRLNAAANHVRIDAIHDDLTAGTPPPVDLVVVGDLFYAADLARRVAAFLDRCLASDTEVLIGDPRRAFLPQTRLRLLAEYPVPDVGAMKKTETMSAVFSLMSPSSASASACSGDADASRSRTG